MQLQTAILNDCTVRQQLEAVTLILGRHVTQRGVMAFFKLCSDAAYEEDWLSSVKLFLAIECCVRVGYVCSSFNEQEQGVPQGSVLSCSLFALVIDNSL